jgi:arylsulfatase A-like enzyme
MEKMTRKKFLKLSLGAAAAVASAPYLGGCAPAFIKKQKPNLLLIITDQQAIDTISHTGCTELETPWLDKYCREGVHFQESYTTNPVCSPARSSLLTGRMPSETGVHRNTLSINDAVPNVGQWFRENSEYRSLYAGKWHLPQSWQPSVLGFDLLTPAIKGQGNLGDAVVASACEGYFHNRSKFDNPFIMVASLFQPHDICQWFRMNLEDISELRYPELAGKLPELPSNFQLSYPESEVVGELRSVLESSRGNWSELQWRYYLYVYYRQVEMVDAEIGRILQGLEDSGERENTLVMITSDHGEGMAEHQMIRKNYLYEASAKVPLIVSMPDQIRSDINDTSSLVSGIDLVPTMCDYAGITSPGNAHSRSLRPLLENRESTWRSSLISEVSHDSHGVENQLARMVRTENYKYIVNARDGVEQLFNLSIDSGETDNLALKTGYRSQLAEHKKLLNEWESKLEIASDLPENKTWKNV